MTTQELKNSILQLAIQGKLVEQRLEEGTGEELYQQIQKEKQRLIKAGKIKKEKPLSDISDDEKLFDIPESWIWAKITDCGYFISGYTPQPHQLDSTGPIPYFKVADMNTDGNELYLSITTAYLKDLDAKCFFKNTIVYPKNGGAVFTNKKRILAQDSVVDLNTGGFYPFAPLDLMYVYIFVSTIDFRKCWKGTALPTIDTDKLKKKWLPIPPLAEQRRIVARIKELLPYIDRYEQAWSHLENFNKRFPDDMKKSILQLAIQGRLVEQRSEEGTAEDLYQQIQKEKQRLIKDGKIKKEKPLPEITEEEMPFEIPESWKWVRLPTISSSCLGKMLDRQKNIGTLAPYLRNVNVRWNSFDLDDLLEMKFEDVNDDRFLVQKGDLVMCEGGEPGRCAIWKENYTIHFQKALHRIRFYISMVPQYFQHIFEYYAVSGLLNDFFTGTTIKHLTGKALDKIIVPLPPLAEQKRIVARLEELLPLCERLK